MASLGHVLLAVALVRGGTGKKENVLRVAKKGDEAEDLLVAKELGRGGVPGARRHRGGAQTGQEREMEQVVRRRSCRASEGEEGVLDRGVLERAAWPGASS